jgi:hypothetical protein
MDTEFAGVSTIGFASSPRPASNPPASAAQKAAARQELFIAP